MAKKSKKKRKSYTRRSPEQIIADLQAEIERVKARAAAREAKQSGHGKAFLAAVKATDKAIEVAGGAKDTEMVRALESARATLGAPMVKIGIREPRGRVRR